jgi:hypothetical protein
MKFHCTIERENDQWVVRYSDDAIGPLQTHAATRETAVEKMRGELRYAMELCPCTGESYQHLIIELTEL